MCFDKSMWIELCRHHSTTLFYPTTLLPPPALVLREHHLHLLLQVDSDSESESPKSSSDGPPNRHRDKRFEKSQYNLRCCLTFLATSCIHTRGKEKCKKNDLHCQSHSSAAKFDAGTAWRCTLQVSLPFTCRSCFVPAPAVMRTTRPTATTHFVSPATLL